ncbi:MAG TPA: hypothetical protein V6D17_14010 [Candidatus Obscuribacterales bacterium]
MELANELLGNRPLSMKARQDNTVPFPQGRQPRRVRLGQLLVEAELLTLESLHEALKIAQDSAAPLGKVLAKLNYVSDRDMQSALLAQSLVSEGIIDERTAVKALKTASRDNTSLVAVLESTEGNDESADCTELEELLTRSRMISQAAYDEAKQKSLTEGIPFGRALLLTNGITFAHLNSALEAICLIRDQKIVIEEAIRALKEVRRNHTSLQEAMAALKISPRTTFTRIKLGDLLSRSKVISERESLAAVEKALIEKRMLGEILVGSGLVSCGMLRDALLLQQMVIKDVICMEAAVHTLKRMKESHRTLSEIAAETQLFKDDDRIASGVLALLMKASIITVDHVKRAKWLQAEHQMDALKAVLASEMVTPLTNRAAAACVDLIRAGKLTEAEGVVALQTADRKRCSLAEALVELGAEAQRKRAVNAIAVAQRTVLTEKQKESLKFNAMVLIPLLALVVAACGVLPFFVHVDWLVYAGAAIVVIGAAGMFVVGCLSQKRERKVREEVGTQMEEMKGTLHRLSKTNKVS